MPTVQEVYKGRDGSMIHGYVRPDAPALTFDEALEEAKVEAHHMCGDDQYPICTRRWLTADIPDSDTHKDYHAQLWVLEGSPPKAFLLQTPGFLRVFNWRGGPRATWCEFEEGWWVRCKKRPDYVARIVA